MIHLLKFVNNCRNGLGVFTKGRQIRKNSIKYSTMAAPAKYGGAQPLNRKTAMKLRKKDNVSEDYQLIYRSGMRISIYTYYPLSLLSLVAITSVYYMTRHMDGENSLLKNAGFLPITYENKTQYDIIYASYMFMNWLSLFYCRRAVLRIWYSPEKKDYRLILISIMPPRFTKQVPFKAGELTRKKLDPTNALQEYWHRLNGKTVFLTTREFPSPQSYYHMVGRDFSIE